MSILEGLGSGQEEAATMRLLDLRARSQLVRGGQVRMRDWAHSRSNFAGGLDGGGERGGSGRFHGSLLNSQPVDKKVCSLGPLTAATVLQQPQIRQCRPTQGRKAKQRQEPTATRVRNKARATTWRNRRRKLGRFKPLDSRSLKNRSPKVWKKT
eukprot:3211720-Pleurochrysis_carterae.AAC.1